MSVVQTPFKDTENSFLFQGNKTINKPAQKGLTVFKSTQKNFNVLKSPQKNGTVLKSTRKALGDLTNAQLSLKTPAGKPTSKQCGAGTSFKIDTRPEVVVKNEPSYDESDFICASVVVEEDIGDMCHRRAKEGHSSLYFPSNDPDMEFAHQKREIWVAPEEKCSFDECDLELNDEFYKELMEGFIEFDEGNDSDEA